MNDKPFHFCVDKPQELLMVGITSTLRDYRIGYHMNKVLGFDFVRKADLPFYPSDNGSEPIYSPFFFYYREAVQTTYLLMANRASQGRLIPAHRHADYFLLVAGQDYSLDQEALFKALRSIPNVLMVYRAEMDKIRQMEYLLEDVELHLNEQFPAQRPPSRIALKGCGVQVK